MTMTLPPPRAPQTVYSRSQACDLRGTWMNVDPRKRTLYVFNASGADSYVVTQLGREVATVRVAAPSAGKPQGSVVGQWYISPNQKAIPADITTWSGANSPACSAPLLDPKCTGGTGVSQCATTTATNTGPCELVFVCVKESGQLRTPPAPPACRVTAS